jgi:hypothetical protein
VNGRDGLSGVDWIAKHSDALQVIAAGTAAVVWIVYLQLLLMTVLRQRRPLILIGTGAGVGLESRCFVSNLSFEPLYVMDLTLTLSTAHGERTAFITDRWEMDRQDLTNPGEATNKGPLKSGEFFDIGSFENLVDRARRALDEAIDPGEIDGFELVVIATTAASPAIVAASRGFVIHRTRQERRLVPKTVGTWQIRSLLARRRIKRTLQDRLDEGADAAVRPSPPAPAPLANKAGAHRLR